MKIAVTFDDGKVFQHFGKTEAFKLYHVEDGKINTTEMLDPNGIGHEALADFLAQNGVNVLICGELGNGAQNALSATGIDVISGASGDTDHAVEMYLADKLTSAGVNCDHHGHHEDTASPEGHNPGYDSTGGCGEGGCGDGGCGSSCGGCGGGCSGCGSAERPILFEGKNAGKTVRTHYQGTFDDGTQFDSSYDRGEPLEFVCGTGMMIPGFDKAVVNMEVGEILSIHLAPEDAYGMPDSNMIFTFDQEQLKGSEELDLGARVYLTGAYGQPIPVTVVGKTDATITLDANHEMAGKELNFKIELVSVE